MMREFELPWPPSVNHYYRHVGPRVLISRDGRKYREVVNAIVHQTDTPMLEGAISMQGLFYPPDRRRRDLDNVGGKALIDALQYAGLFKDDCQIKKIHLEMLEPIPGGLCIVKLETFDNVENKNKMLCMRQGNPPMAVSDL